MCVLMPTCASTNTHDTFVCTSALTMVTLVYAYNYAFDY